MANNSTKRIRKTEKIQPNIMCEHCQQRQATHSVKTKDGKRELLACQHCAKVELAYYGEEVIVKCLVKAKITL